MQHVKYDYKDANRQWWRVEGTRFNNSRNANFECRWDCTVWLVDDRGERDTLLWQGQLFVNENGKPKAGEIMAEYAAFLVRIAVEIE